MIVDFSIVEHLIPNIAAVFNIQPATALLIVIAISVACNIGGRLIPDDKVGYMGLLRKVLKILGGVVANRVVGKVTPNDAARVIVDTAESWTKVELPPAIESVVKDKVEDLVEDAVEEVVPAFPKFKRDSSGRFAPKSLPEPLGDPTNEG